MGFREHQPKNRIADILSASERSAPDLLNEPLGTLFALCAQADKMSAIRFSRSKNLFRAS
jgi:hypothetical protein